MKTQKKFHLILVRPTRYDDDGYPIHWWRSSIPSNSLACMYGIALDCKEKRILGEDTEIIIQAVDEAHGALNRVKLINQIKQDGGQGLLALVGVQSNQYPRAVDLAKPFIAADIPVCIGGFHVSGCLSMFPQEMRPELKQAVDMGISLFSGEAEEQRFEQILLDAWKKKLQPVYSYINDLPGLSHQPLPYTPPEVVKKSLFRCASIDLGRGCPFICSFCCIINVQGRKSRYRTVEDLEQTVRRNYAMKVRLMFITDDNFARNKNWELFFDKLIELRNEGLNMFYIIQVDTLSYRIPGFIEKAVKAGVGKVFIGLENINSENLLAVNKKQNKIIDYKKMLIAWKRHPVIVDCGYIIGFPNDTKASILRDIEIIKKELPLDFLFITILTPLPGSEDHKKHLEQGLEIDSDLNKFDLTHRVAHHAKMTDQELEEVYDMAWNNYYTPEHMETILRRMFAFGSNKKFSTVRGLVLYGVANRVYKSRSYDLGLFRIKNRTDRRPGLPLESVFAFYPKFLFELVTSSLKIFWADRKLLKKMWQIYHDPEKINYRDAAMILPVDEDMPTSSTESDETAILGLNLVENSLVN